MKRLLQVSAAVVAYNNPQEVDGCLTSLFASQGRLPWEDLGVTEGDGPAPAPAEKPADIWLTVYVSDNSTDPEAAEEMKRLAAAFPEAVFLPSEGNRGFGAGHNRVLPLLESEYHLLVNPDITLTEGTIETMVAYMEAHPEVSLMMPEVLNPDGSRQYLPKKNPSWYYLIGGRLSKKIRAEYCRRNEAMDVPTEIEFASGCFMLLRTALFRELGGFDGRYFLYLEDADLCRQAAKRGKVLFFPDARVTHSWHRASGKNLKALRLHIQSAGKYLRKWRKES